MKWLTIAVLAVGLSAGCGDSSEDRCRDAIRNIFKITGLDKTSSGPDEHAAIRSCRANASRDAIKCMIEAKTMDDLSKCEGDFVLKKGDDESAAVKEPAGETGDKETPPE
jgi:hypothetical protein